MTGRFRGVRPPTRQCGVSYNTRVFLWRQEGGTRPRLDCSRPPLGVGDQHTNARNDSQRLAMPRNAQAEGGIEEKREGSRYSLAANRLIVATGGRYTRPRLDCSRPRPGVGDQHTNARNDSQRLAMPRNAQARGPAAREHGFPPAPGRARHGTGNGTDAIVSRSGSGENVLYQETVLATLSDSPGGSRNKP